MFIWDSCMCNFRYVLYMICVSMYMIVFFILEILDKHFDSLSGIINFCSLKFAKQIQLSL